MAVVPFVNQNAFGENTLWKATVLSTGDQTDVLKFTEDQSDVSVHIYGTVAGSTVAIQASLLGEQFNTVDDAYGVAMSYTAIGIVKPVGPAIKQMRVTVTGGAGVSVTVDVLASRRRGR